MDLVRFLKIIHITDSDPIKIIKEISEINSFNVTYDKEIEDLKNEMSQMNQRMSYLQSHNDFLKKTLEKYYDKT